MSETIRVSSPRYPQGLGRIVVFSQDKKRAGNRADIDNIRTTFRTLYGPEDFDILDFSNLTKRQTLEKLEELRTSNHNEYVYLMVIVLAHGCLKKKSIEDCYGQNGTLYQLSVRVEQDGPDRLSRNLPVTVFEDFISKSYPKYFEKRPRVLILQSCQGNNRVQAFNQIDLPRRTILAVRSLMARWAAKLNINQIFQDNFTPDVPESDDEETDNGSEVVLDNLQSGIGLTVCAPNVAYVYATVPGYTCYRHSQRGTWFIEEFCREIQRDSKQDFESLIKTVMVNILSSRIQLQVVDEEETLERHETSTQNGFFVSSLSQRFILHPNAGTSDSAPSAFMSASNAE